MAFSDSVFAHRELIILAVSSLVFVGSLGFNLLEAYRRKTFVVIDHLMQRVEFGKEDDECNIVDTLGERLGSFPDAYGFIAHLASRGMLLKSLGAPSVRHHLLLGDKRNHSSGTRLVYAPSGRGIAWYQTYRQSHDGTARRTGCLTISSILAMLTGFLFFAMLDWHTVAPLCGSISAILFSLSSALVLDAPPRQSYRPEPLGRSKHLHVIHSARIGSVTERSLHAIIARLPAAPKRRARA